MDRAKRKRSGPASTAELTLSKISGKWKMPIVCQLSDGPKRFSELQRAFVGITQRMLTKQLRELEADQIINRKVYPQVPPKVEYSLTPIGDKLKPILLQLKDWGSYYLQATGTQMPK